MSYVIDFAGVVTLPVVESSKAFPVGRIYCVGRNYAEHAREMGHDPDREPPFFFMKPADAIVQNGATIPYPQMTKDVHHEIEMIVAIGKGGANIPVEKALDHVYGYGVGLDMTRRDLQGEAKKMGLDISPLSGEESQAVADKIVAARPEVIERAKLILEGAAK